MKTADFPRRRLFPTLIQRLFGGALIVLLSGVTPVNAAETPSLFLTPAETAAQDSFHQATTRLGAIVYFGPGQWKVWIDGRTFVPTTQDAAVTILTVSPDTVRFKQRLGTQDREIVLAPHQVYLWAENRIVEAGAVPESAGK